jgi:hypothetical protein
VAAEAQARGIEPIELGRGQDLETLVRRTVAGGADGLAMAGGDGSQAVVAAMAAELGLPHGCVPVGTRSHFALGLGVDRDDVIGALDAFVAPGTPARRPRRCCPKASCKAPARSLARLAEGRGPEPAAVDPIRTLPTAPRPKES